MHDVEREEIERLAKLHGVVAVLEVLQEMERREAGEEPEAEPEPPRPEARQRAAPAPQPRVPPLPSGKVPKGKHRQASIHNFQDPTVLRCSFCWKERREVCHLIAGQGVYICDDCIDHCQDILDREWFDLPEDVYRRPADPSSN